MAGRARAVRPMADGLEASHPLQSGQDLGQDLRDAARPGRRRWGDRLGGQHRLHDQSCSSARDHLAPSHRGTCRITGICASSQLTTPSGGPAAGCPRRSTTPWTARAGRSQSSSVPAKAATLPCAYRSWTPSASRAWDRVDHAPARTRSWQTRRTPPVRSAPSSAAAASPRSFQSLATSRTTASAAAQPVVARSPTTPAATRAATSSSARSAYSSSGAAWRPATTAPRHLARRRRPRRHRHLAALRTERKAHKHLSDIL